MQPANDKESCQAKSSLIKNVECKSDLTKHGARLQPISFGYLSCTDKEIKFHCFTGEEASGRFRIGGI